MSGEDIPAAAGTQREAAPAAAAASRYEPPGGGRLNRPVRAVIAVVETLVAAAAVMSGIWLWHAGIVGISYPIGDGSMLDSSRLLGNHAGGAVALVTFGGLLLVEAIREVGLARRAHPRRKEQRELAEWRRIESEARGGEGDARA